jgi:tetratricopeptide (TPR) repeat protein
MKAWVLVLVSVLIPAVAAAQVSVSETTISLPTYLEGAPDPNPPFEEMQPLGTAPFYPYTWRTIFTGEKVEHAWRALILENEYLKCTFLLDLGGHLYSCIDKLSGKDMFYANSCIKKNWVAPRGAFAALGVEFNFPIGHSWVTVSPVDFATRQNADGSKSVIVSSIDRVTHMQWRVESTLRPAVGYLEQKVTLYNRSKVRQRYSWWATAAVPMEDESTTFVMPAKLTTQHRGEHVDNWPVDSSGVDMSIAGNHKDQTALFARGSREPFLAVYQPKSRSGTIHYADPAQMPGKKIWSWGANPENGNPWVRKNLSDDGTSYVEIQAGLFENQETFEFLEPQESRSFREYWMPVRNLGGISRANLSAALNVSRSQDHDGTVQLKMEVQAYRPLSNVTLQILNGRHALLSEVVDLTPRTNLTRTLHGVAGAVKYRVQFIDRNGAVLLAHTEDSYDARTSTGEIKTEDYGKSSRNPPTTASEFLRRIKRDELDGNVETANAECESALRAFPGNSEILKAAGRILISLNRPDAAVKTLEKARAALPLDFEVRYYLGLAYVAQGLDQKAVAEFSVIAGKSELGLAAITELAAIAARGQRWSEALQLLRKASTDAATETRLGAMEIACLRNAGRQTEAKARLAYWQGVDPSDLFLRFEAIRLGHEDPGFFRQLAADPERVLNIVSELFEQGRYEDSLILTDHVYPPVDPLDAEPGTVPPQNYPLVVYYRGFARQQLGQTEFAGDFRTASKLSALYVFPSRLSSLQVLQAALKQDPNDATAHYLLGTLYFHFQRYEEAIGEWQKARAVRADFPGLYRNLGYALLTTKNDISGAIEVLNEGLALNPHDAQLAEGLRQAEGHK